MGEITQKDIEALRDRIDNAARRLAHAELDAIRNEYADIEREADEIDREVDRITEAIRRGARPSGTRFRL